MKKKIISLSDLFFIEITQKFQSLAPKLGILYEYIIVKSDRIRNYLLTDRVSSPIGSPLFTKQPQTKKTSEQILDHSKQILKEDHELVINNKPDDAEILNRQDLNVQPPKLTISVNSVSEVARLRRAAWAFTTRRVPLDSVYSMICPECSPNAGDLVLARVDLIGHHTGLQMANGRRRKMFQGDEIVVAYGNRYASSQFEALIPKTMGPCHLVAGGGVASRAISWHNRITKGPTHITPIGLLMSAQHKRINLRDFAIFPINQISGPYPTTVAIVGTSMDSGKTQTAAYLAKGLIAGGLSVGYAKITGTGAGGDTWLLKDAGALPVLDFTDAGMATTYLASPTEIEAILMTLMGQIMQDGVDVIILEIADGVFQRETAELLQSPVFSQLVGGIIVAARDSMGASAGVNWLNTQKTQVLALSGVISSAPLQSQEAKLALDLPVYNRDELSTSIIAVDLISQVQHGSQASGSPKILSQVLH